MKLPITLRSALASDAEFVNWLTRTVMDDYVRNTWDSPEEHSKYFQKNSFDIQTTKIIQVNGNDIGRLSVVEEPDDSVWIDNIHLIPEVQGMGVGQALLQALVEQCRKQGKCVKLQLLKVNPARRLYERVGFELYHQDAERIYMRANYCSNRP